MSFFQVCLCHSLNNASFLPSLLFDWACATIEIQILAVSKMFVTMNQVVRPGARESPIAQW